MKPNIHLAFQASRLMAQPHHRPSILTGNVSIHLFINGSHYSLSVTYFKGAKSHKSCHITSCHTNEREIINEERTILILLN